nr:hypothetical protein [Tanacetum cinerariifolium]
MGLKEESERLKRKGLNLEKEQVKKKKSSEEPPEIETTTKEFTEDKIKEIMQLIIRLGGSCACYQFFVDLLRQLDREDLNQLWALVKEYLSIRPVSSDKEMKLWVELKRMYEQDPEDQFNTCLVETDYSNVIPDSPNICKDDIQNDQNDVESDDEHVALANLIANLKLDVKSSYWQYKFPLPVKVVSTARRLEMLLPEVCTANEEKKKKLPVKDRWQLH